MKQLLSASAVPAVVLAVLRPFAQDLRKGVHKRDRFFLRVSTELGQADSSEKAKRIESSLYRRSGQYSMAVGFAIIPNLILPADLFGTEVANPTVSLDANEVGEAKDIVTRSYALGGGATYYFMPINIYLCGTVGLALTDAKYKDTKIGESETGLGINFMAGKEWWISDNWGLGVALQLIVTGVPNEDEATGETEWLNTAGFGVLFSATYN